MRVSASEAQALEPFFRALRLGGDGGGGDAGGMLLAQSSFLDSPCGQPAGCDAPCNAVTIQWDETSLNPEELQVFVDEVLVGTVPGLSPERLPGRNSVHLINVAAGPRTLRVSGADGSTAEASIEVLDSQPFGDPTDMRCSSSGAGPNSNGNCELLGEWTNAATPPDTYGVSLDGVFLGALSGVAGRVVIRDVRPGPHTFSVLGFKAASHVATYTSCPLESTCDLECVEVPCAPPRALSLCQVAYGDGNDNVLLAQWINGEEVYVGGLTGVVDGLEASAISNDLTGASPSRTFLGSLTPGLHAIGVQGVCEGEGINSPLLSRSFEVLEVTPHPQPIDGEVACSYSEEDQSTTLSWTPADPSSFLAVYREEGSATLGLVGFSQGEATFLTLGPSRVDDVFVLQFFSDGAAGCYGSGLYRCVVDQPGERYVQGICNGVGDAAGNPQITAAIFGLTYLFGGGAAPPCVAACDSNGDRRFDLSDMIFILSYLFSGGPAPPSWTDKDGDGFPDAVCAVAQPGDDCESGQARCSR